MNELENINVDKLYNDVADLIEKAKARLNRMQRYYEPLEA